MREPTRYPARSADLAQRLLHRRHDAGVEVRELRPRARRLERLDDRRHRHQRIAPVRRPEERVTPRAHRIAGRVRLHLRHRAGPHGDNLLAAVGVDGRALLAQIPAFVPHPRIAEHAREAGLSAVTTAAGGDGGLVAALLEWFAAHPVANEG